MKKKCLPCQAKKIHEGLQVTRVSCRACGRFKRGGHSVCGTHARQFDRWEQETYRGPNPAQSMAEFWWGWKSQEKRKDEKGEVF